MKIFPSLILFAVLSSLAACSKPSTSTEKPLPKIRVLMDWFPEAEHGGYYTASIKGYWKELGIDVEVVSTGPAGGPNSGGSVEKRVSLDSHALGVSRGDEVFLSVERGLPIIAVNAHMQHDEQSLIVHDESPVKGFADLEGHKVGVPPGALFYTCLAKKYHLKNVKMEPFTGTVAPFLVDKELIIGGYPTYEPYVANKGGQKVRVLPIYLSGFDPYRLIVANRKMFDEHPEWIRAFSIGAYRGWKEYFRDPAPAHELMKKLNPEMDDAFLAYAYKVIRNDHYIAGDPAQGEFMGRMTPEKWTELQTLMLDYGLIQKKLPLDQVVSFDFTPEKVGIDPALPPVP
jgi:NitT/TauT family transport system substrate-binding protein